MVLRFASAVFVLGLLWAPASALARTPPTSAETLRSSIQLKLKRWEVARMDVARARLEQSELARRIDALKRRGDAGQALRALLERSVAAERTLKETLRRSGQARDDAKEGIRGGITELDAEVRRLLPALKQGPKRDRRAAARRINALRAARRELRASARTLESSRSARSKQSWSRYQVNIEPLDGPVELEEKADFVEDTRDKLAKKRVALAKLLVAAKEERRIARAARDFDTYVGLFDEEARSARVVRERGTSNAARFQGDGASAAAANESPAASSGGPEGSAVDATIGSTPSNTPDDSVESSANNDLGSPQAVGRPTAFPTAETPDGASAAAARDINAELLINLQVSQLGGQDLDLDTLLRLVEELEQLDGYLAEQASTIRSRARSIASDEAPARK